MDTTGELTNRMIAEAKARVDGWRVEQHGERNWWVIRPNGTVYRAGVGEELHGWWMAADTYPTAYLISKDAALSLVNADFELQATVTEFGLEWSAKFKSQEYWQAGMELAVVVCRAFMAYAQQRGGYE